jgi:hypothetical protein
MASLSTPEPDGVAASEDERSFDTPASASSAGTQDERPRRRYVRFTRWRRRRFFAVLEETGNAEMAAEAAGVSQSCIYRLRRVEAGFSERMAAAVAAADRRLGGTCPHPPGAEAPGTLSLSGRGEGLVVRRGIGGRLRVMAAGTRWWTERDDAIFFGNVRATGNVAASARAAGFTPKSAWNRRRRVASFARALDDALEVAEIRLEWRVFQEAASGTWAMEPGAFEAEEPKRFDPWLAMNFLNYRENRRQGRHYPTPRRPVGPEEAYAAMHRNIDIIERHRARYGPDHDEGEGEGTEPR